MMLAAQHNNIMLFVCVSYKPCNQLLPRLSPTVPFLQAVLFFQAKSNRRGKKSNKKSKELSNFMFCFQLEHQNLPNLFPLQHFHRQEYSGSYARLPGIGNFSNFFFSQDCENLGRLIRFFKFGRTLFSLVKFFS